MENSPKKVLHAVLLVASAHPPQAERGSYGRSAQVGAAPESGGPADAAQRACYVLRRNQPPLKHSDQAEVTRIGGLIRRMEAPVRRPRPLLDTARLSVAVPD